MNNETFEFENRQYVSPDVSRDEQTAFIDAFRNAQAESNQQLAENLQARGSDVPTQLGGLTGTQTFIDQYQTPQTEAMVANLKTVAQQTALNNALSNYSSMLQNRYNQAYRNYQQRQYAHQKNREAAADAATKAAQEQQKANIVVNELKDTPSKVTVDPFVQQKQQQQLYEDIVKKQAASKGITVEQQKAQDQKTAKAKASTAPNPSNLAYGLNNGAFASGLPR